MLTLLLVWTVALGSLTIFGAGMVFPELSRKNDLIWVGVGLFYALILWANTGNIGGGLLLGQTAGISLTVWLGWQTLTQRRQLTPSDKKTPVPDWLQKIVDTVTPLWQQAYGLVAGQLGLDESTEGNTQAGTDNSGSDLKSKVLGFLDKLNPKPADVVTEDSAIGEEEASSPEVSHDVSEETETVSEAVDVVVDIAEPEPVDVVEENAAAETVEAPSSSETPSSEGDEPTEEAAVAQEVIEDSVPDVEAPMEGEISGGSEPPTDLQDDATPVDSPIQDDAAEHQDAEEPSTDAIDNSVEATGVQASHDEPEVVAENSAEPEEQAEAIAENLSPDMVEESDQEDSNWPPEPTDYN